MKNKRILVGRRFEDFQRNGISIQRSLSEHILHNLITDIRYQFFLDRRKRVRRQSDFYPDLAQQLFRPASCLPDEVNEYIAGELAATDGQPD